MLSKELELSLNRAFTEARSKRHEYMTVEHLLLSLIDDESSAKALMNYGVDLKSLKRDLINFIDSTTPTFLEDDPEIETQPTLGFQRVLQRSVFHVQASGKKEVLGVNVLVAMFSEEDSEAVRLLEKQKISRLDLVEYIAHGEASLEEEQALEDAFEKEYNEDFDYKDLLRLKEEELESVKNELERLREDTEAKLKLHQTTKSQLNTKVKDSEKIIKELEARIAEIGTFDDADTIIRSIEFNPEHRQAGLGILSYFSEVVKQKYPDKNISVSIKQEDNIVSLIIITEEGDKEIIERALDQYGKVIIGDLLPRELFNNPLHTAQLENKIEIANTEIRSLERLLGIQDNTITYLKESIGMLSRTNCENQKTLNCAIDKISSNENIDAIIELFKSLEERDALTTQEVTAVKNAVTTISTKYPDSLHKLKQYCSSVSTSIVGSIVSDTLKMLGLM